MRTAKINANGMDQIAQALAKHHKLSHYYLSPDDVYAFADEAERNFSNGTGCYFEIKPEDSESGLPVVVLVGDDGFDIEQNGE